MGAAEKTVGTWTYDLDTDEVVHCPECLGDNVHLAAVQVNQGGQVHEIKRAGHSRSLAPPSGRGTSIGVRIVCEDCPAVHVIAYQFHKGRTFTGTIREPDRPDGEWEEMWRD